MWESQVGAFLCSCLFQLAVALYCAYNQVQHYDWLPGESLKLCAIVSTSYDIIQTGKWGHLRLRIRWGLNLSLYMLNSTVISPSQTAKNKSSDDLVLNAPSNNFLTDVVYKYSSVMRKLFHKWQGNTDHLEELVMIRFLMGWMIASGRSSHTLDSLPGWYEFCFFALVQLGERLLSGASLPVVLPAAVRQLSGQRVWNYLSPWWLSTRSVPCSTAASN